jgi:hypothetical protein
MRVNKYGLAVCTALLAMTIGSAANAAPDIAKCEDAVAKGSRNVGNQEQKKNRKCVKDGAGDVDACVDAESPKAGIKRTKLQDLYAPGGKCDGVAAQVNPDANDIADDTEDAAGDILRGAFGDPVDGIVSGSKCHDKIAKRAGKKFDTELKAFRGCVKTNAPLTQLEVDACVAAGVNDAKAQSTVQPKLLADITGQCTFSSPPAGLEDGACAACNDAACLATCVGDIVDCQACLAMNNSNNGGASCDLLDDGSVNCSCFVGACCGSGVAEGSEQCDGGDLGSCPGGAGCFPAGGPNECECQPASCSNIDANGANANSSGTFFTTSVGAPQSGAKYCGGLSVANAFGTCVTDVECGGSVGQCQPIPWLGVGSFAPFAIAKVDTTFTATGPDAKCVHAASVHCIGSSDPCPGTPALVGSPCCTTAGFKVDTFFITALGFCSRVDQTACGGGIVDTSLPMVGDNDLTKIGDTTTPAGAGCTYNGTEVHPACAATEDKLGQVQTTIGDGFFDAPGVHTRLSIPQRSVTWLESTAPPCDPTDTFDPGDLPITNFDLVLSTTTATSSGGYLDSAGDADAIAFCGAGPAAFMGTPVGAPDLPAAGSRTVAVGPALSGGAPLYDLTFSAVTPLTSPVLVAPVAACAPPAPGCPE